MQLIIIIRYYFQTPTPDTLIAYGFLGVIKHYGWKKVRLVAQDENVFTAVSVKSIMHTLFSADYFSSTLSPWIF